MKTVIIFRVGMALLLSMLYTQPVTAADGEETSRQKYGFAYPGGYDVNTVRVVEAKVIDFERPDHGPVILEIRDDRRSYRVLAGPHWFWRDGPEWREGDPVRVKGSLVQGRDGRLYIMAAEISAPGADGEEKAIRLRNSRGEPLWMGRHGMMGGPRRGMRR